MDKVIRYEEQWGALPSMITLKRGECQYFPQAVEESDRQICNRNMLGHDLLIFPKEAPPQLIESNKVLDAFAKQVVLGATFETLSPDEQARLAYHHQRRGNILTLSHQALPAAQTGQRVRGLLIKPR